MRASFSPLPTKSQTGDAAPALIAVGLSLLLLATWWPILPAATGMALIALGATGATAERFRGTPALLPVLVAHLAIYGGLYALFVGAALHAAVPTNGRVGLAAAVDLAASIWPMAAVLGLVGDVLRGSRSAE